MNENQLTIVEEYKFDKSLIQKVDFIIDIFYRDCHNKYSHRFEYKCVYDIKLTNIRTNEMINWTIAEKSMNLYELNEKLEIAPQNGFVFNQINKLTIFFYSNLSRINIHYYLKLQIPIMHRHFFKILPQNPEYVQTHCNDRNNPFHFACLKWYLYNNPHRWYSIIILILVQISIFTLIQIRIMLLLFLYLYN